MFGIWESKEKEMKVLFHVWLVHPKLDGMTIPSFEGMDFYKIIPN